VYQVQVGTSWSAQETADITITRFAIRGRRRVAWMLALVW